MRRGFLNGKKAKDQHRPLRDDDGAHPLKQSEDGATTTSVSRPKKLSEPIVGISVIVPTNVHDLEPYAVVRFPPLKATKSKEPSSICILRPSTCHTITNTPGYYTPLPPLNPTDVVFTKRTPNMGLGLFAKRDAKIYQVIFPERALLIFPQGMPFNRLEGLSEEEAIHQYELKFEETLQKSLSIMAKEEADAFLGLSSCMPNSPQLYGIVRTNSFSTGSHIEEENLEEGKPGYGAVGKLASRINHSCMPNVYVDFHVPTFSLRVIALRDIQAGEQILFSYCQEERSVKERKRQLATYGFVCQCKACVNATPESDKLREEIDDRIQQILDGKEKMFSNPQFSIRSLDPLLKLEKDIVREGLDFKNKFVHLLLIILEAYRELNDVAKGMEYYEKLNKYTGKAN